MIYLSNYRQALGLWILRLYSF